MLAGGSDGSEIRGLEVRDFLDAGISVASADNTISSNIVRSNSRGIVVSDSEATGNVIGADAEPGDLFVLNFALGNVVVENDGNGIEINQGATGTVVAANFVGTDRDDTPELGNGGAGIYVEESSGNQLGPGNRVTNNGDTGTGVRIESGSQNRIVANFIYENIGRGIVLDEGANDDLNSPTLDSATLDGGTTTVEGSIDSVPDGSYFVEFFVNAACDSSEEGEGESFVTFASVTASDGTASFSQTLGGLEVGDVITATLTGVGGTSNNNTSEFSNCATVAEGEPLPEGQEPVRVTASDDNPEDDTLDLYLHCGPTKPKQVIAVGLPSNRHPTSASWSTNYDSTLAPANCELEAIVMDGFTDRRSLARHRTDTSGPNALVAAISSPRGMPPSAVRTHPTPRLDP